jgi:hypothetical protein
MMALPEADGAAREATAVVPMVERPSQGGRNRPGPRPDFQYAARLVVAHHHPARVARQAPRRFRGNVAPLFEHGLAGLLRIRQHGGIDVDHHLVAISGSAGIEALMQRRFREQAERIRLSLGHRRQVAGRVDRPRPRRGPRPLV